MLLRAAIQQLQDGKVKWESLYAAAIRARLRCDMNLSDVLDKVAAVDNLGIPILIETARKSAIQASNQYTDQKFGYLRDNQIAALDHRCTDLESRMIAIDRDDPPGPPGRMKAAENDIGALQDRMTTAESDIQSLQSDMKKVLETYLPWAYNKITGIEGDISNLETDLSTKADASDIPAPYDDSSLAGQLQSMSEILNGNTFVRNDKPDHKLSLNYEQTPDKIVITGFIDGSEYPFKASSGGGGGGFAAMANSPNSFLQDAGSPPSYAGENWGNWTNEQIVPEDGYVLITMRKTDKAYQPHLHYNGTIIASGDQTLIIPAKAGDRFAADSGKRESYVSAEFKFFNYK